MQFVKTYGYLKGLKCFGRQNDLFFLGWGDNRSGYLPSDTESPRHVCVHFYLPTICLSLSLWHMHTQPRTHIPARIPAGSVAV